MCEAKELKMEDFWKYLDEGKFKICHKLLNQSVSHTSDESIKRIATYFRELRYKEAYEFAFAEKNKCSNYVKGFTSFKHPRNMKKEEYLPFIRQAVDYLESAINKNEIGFYNKVVAQTMLIEAYLILDKKEKSFDISKEIIDEYSSFSDSSSILNGKYQVYLIDAFNDKYSAEERTSKLKNYFELSKYERYKTFDDIIKYSHFLKYKPDDLLEAFSESQFGDEDGYLHYVLLEEAADEKESKKLRNIWFWQHLILSQLMITEDSKIQEISHYTSQSTFDLLLNKDTKIAEFSLSNANDKVEGNILSDILIDNDCIDKSVKTENTNPFIAVQTSYSRNKNSLTMFRLYGKKDDKEGTGVSLVFNKNFFQTNPVKINENKDKSILDLKLKDSLDLREPLFWILYYNSERKILYFYPSEDELKPYEIDLKIDSSLKWNTYMSYKDQTEMKQRNLLYSFKHLFKEVRETKNRELAVKVLYKLRYFIKSSDFAEEKELRMLDLQDPIELKNAGYKLYKEYKNIRSYDSLESVIVGPKVENKVGYSEYVRKQLGTDDDIAVIPSDAPLA